MKYYIYFILFTISMSCYTQDSLKYYNDNINTKFKKNDLNGSDYSFKTKLDYLKDKDNLEEYYYAHFDYFMLNPITKRISVLKNADLNKWRKTISNNEKIAKLHVLINIGYHLKEYSAISKSVVAYENALYFYEITQARDYDITEYCLKPLANNYMRLGDYKNAEEALKNTINLLETTNNKAQLVATYSNLSNLYSLTNKPKKANLILQNLLLNIKLTQQQQSEIHTKIANNYYDLGDIDNSKKHLKKSISGNPNTKTQLKNMTLKGIFLYDKKEYQKAKHQFEFTYDFINSKIKKNNRDLNKLLLLIAKTNIKLNKLNSALNNYQMILMHLIPKFKTKTNIENPLIKNLYAENILIDALEGKANVYIKQGKATLAIKNFELANNVASLLSNVFISQDSKIVQQTKNRKRNEKIVDLYYVLYLKTKDKKYLNKAFYTIENTKAKVLNTSLQNKYINLKFAKDSLFILKEKLVKQKAIFTKNILVEELKEENANVSYIKNKIALKTKLTTKLQWLNQQINNKYPLLKVENNSITVNEIQNEILLKNQLLVSFFETEKQWYIFSLTKKDDLKLRVLPKKENLQNNISNYINFFFNGNDNALKNDVSLYQKTAHFLYQKLLQPELNENFDYLTIIPDNTLNFLTFDALLTKPITGINFSNFPFLVKEQAINTSFSANILRLQKQNEVKNKNKTAIGYFPVFKNQKRALQTLPYTLDEQKQFNIYTNGTSMIEEKATKKHFLDHFKNYHQIHLATHANAGNFEQPAQIEFYDETLYLSEIYGLNMQTDLLVLSACETGIGKMQKGEGVMSLARGFSYAGVKNLVVSLWKVNDKATSKLMANFYKRLKHNSKIKAMQLAKLDYLKNSNISTFKKSPYYWSSFVFIGNAETVSTTNNYWNFLVIGGVLLLVVLVYFRFKKYK